MNNTPRSQTANPAVLPWRDRVLQAALLRVRPAALASFLKRAFRVRRRVVETAEGRFLIDPVSHFGAALTRDGVHEPGTVDAIRQFLTPGGTFVDVGANEGYFTVIAGRLAGPTGRVVAVEPQPRLRGVIEHNLSLNGLKNVTVCETAIADSDRRRTMFVTPDVNTGASGMARATSYRLPAVSVAAVTLAELLDRTGLATADLVKMDIEGFENEAILGSPDAFRRHRVRAIAVELHPPILRQCGQDPEAVPRFLTECGYRRDDRFGNPVFVVPAGLA